MGLSSFKLLWWLIIGSLVRTAGAQILIDSVVWYIIDDCLRPGLLCSCYLWVTEFCENAITSLLFCCHHHKNNVLNFARVSQGTKFFNKEKIVTMACNISSILFCLPSYFLSYCLLIYFCFHSLSFSPPQGLQYEECWGLVNVFYCFGCHFVSRKYLIMWTTEHCTIFSLGFFLSKLQYFVSFLKVMPTLINKENPVVYTVFRMQLSYSNPKSYFINCLHVFLLN